MKNLVFYILFFIACAEPSLFSQSVELDINLTMDIITPNEENGAFYTFIVTNNSKDTIVTTHLPTMFNRIAIITPDGKKDDYYIAKRPSFDLIPGETKSWEIDLDGGLFNILKKKYGEGSEVTFYWKLYDEKSSIIVEEMNTKTRKYQYKKSENIKIKL